LIAPVAPVGFDPMAREHLAGVEGDEGDVGLVDDREDPTPRMGDPGVEVVEPPGPAERDDAVAVGNVIAQAEMAAASRTRRARLRRRSIRLARRPPSDSAMRSFLVVGEAEGVEKRLEVGESGRLRSGERRHDVFAEIRAEAVAGEHESR